jgi:hypothetical protein
MTVFWSSRLVDLRVAFYKPKSPVKGKGSCQKTMCVCVCVCVWDGPCVGGFGFGTGGNGMAGDVDQSLEGTSKSFSQSVQGEANSRARMRLLYNNKEGWNVRRPERSTRAGAADRWASSCWLLAPEMARERLLWVCKRLKGADYYRLRKLRTSPLGSFGTR